MKCLILRLKSYQFSLLILFDLYLGFLFGYLLSDSIQHLIQVFRLFKIFHLIFFLWQILSNDFSYLFHLPWTRRSSCLDYWRKVVFLSWHVNSSDRLIWVVKSYFHAFSGNLLHIIQKVRGDELCFSLFGASERWVFLVHSAVDRFVNGKLGLCSHHKSSTSAERRTLVWVLR